MAGQCSRRVDAGVIRRINFDVLVPTHIDRVLPRMDSRIRGGGAYVYACAPSCSRNSYCKSRLKTRADSRCNRRREYVGPVIPVLQVDLGRIRRTSLGRISTAIYLTETRPYIIGVTQFDVVHASVRVRDLRAQTEVVVSGDYT